VLYYTAATAHALLNALFSYFYLFSPLLPYELTSDSPSYFLFLSLYTFLAYLSLDETFLTPEQLAW
jgi:hypothetical protein